MGLAIPIVGFAVMLMVNDYLHKAEFKLPDGSTFDFNDQTCFVLGVCFNLIPFQYYKKRNWDATLKGMLAATIIFAFILAFWVLVHPEFSIGK